MQIITKNQNKILILLKHNREKYPENISYDKIRDLLDISETHLMDSLEALEKKNFIELDSANKLVNYVDLDTEIKIVEDKKALKKYMLNKTEEDAYEIIQEVIEQHENYVPKFILEGSLLYGNLELTPKKTYNIIVSLENRGLLKKINKTDGEYYTL